MTIRSLEQEKKDFYSYALYIQDARGYKSRWLYVIFREYFGERLSQEIIDKGKPSKPSQQFMEWLNSTLVRNSNDSAKISEQRVRATTLQKAQKQPKFKPKRKEGSYAPARVEAATNEEPQHIDKLLTAKVNETLLATFKDACENQDTTASQAVRAFMRDYVKKHGQAKLL